MRRLLVGSWGTAEWVAFATVMAVQASLITVLLVTLALTAVNLQALASE
jgi:hypothetical protein